MLKMSKQVDYGLQFLTALESTSKDHTLSLRTFSKENSISFLFLQKIAGSLKKAGIVGSVQGAGGGYYLTKNIAKLTVRDVIEAVEGPYALALCQKESGACTKEHDCSIKEPLSKMRDDIATYLEGVSVKDFAI